MDMPVVNTVMPGFSQANRIVMYASLLLTPAQAIAGMGSRAPFNLGFLAYNMYQQYLWYTAAKSKELHALSLLPTYLNLIYSFTYLGGVPSANIFVGMLAALGTAAMMMMNIITGWVSLKTNLPEGEGVYIFYFFGWRTLTKSWMKFLVAWQVFDTLIALAMIGVTVVLGYWIPKHVCADDSDPFEKHKFLVRKKLYPLVVILVGPPVLLVLVGWELILFMELLVNKNNIESETDMVSIYLFIVQALLTPAWAITHKKKALITKDSE
ncbi:hypothetical protein CVT24_005527 [Panaeolus cyanescens]|uniref:Uncharacterized protein n=1 Tax=Panaeolus cyanescens TaxID=181874 RepID=A0A409YBX0_9AGAR|nr:hypothetical protein CVT24_005527 [Panaeolus cyanescens]